MNMLGLYGPNAVLIARLADVLRGLGPGEQRQPTVSPTAWPSTRTVESIGLLRSMRLGRRPMTPSKRPT